MKSIIAVSLISRIKKFSVHGLSPSRQEILLVSSYSSIKLGEQYVIQHGNYFTHSKANLMSTTTDDTHINGN